MPGLVTAQPGVHNDVAVDFEAGPQTRNRIGIVPGNHDSRAVGAVGNHPDVFDEVVPDRVIAHRLIGRIELDRRARVLNVIIFD